MAKKKAIQKAIRIGGKRVSQRFSSKEAAEFWYNQMFNKKHFQSDGVVTPHGKKVQFKDYIFNEWLVDRKKNYPASTWMSDEQRLVDHVIPIIGNMHLNKITSVHIRSLLINLRANDKPLAPSTRNRVRAVISSVFSDALNRDEPLVASNPTFGLKFSSKRTGNKAPSNLHTSKDCIAFLGAAKELGETHFVVAALGLMSGLRKQEMIALRWDAIDYSGRVIEVSQKYIQAAKKIVQGTKKGENTARYIPVSKELLGLLKTYQKKSEFKSDIDFVLAKKDGSHFEPKTINNMINAVCEKAKLKVTVHGLRHTFGREFAANSGNMRALQEILGHSNMSTTELYSKLGKDRLTGFREIVSFDLDSEEKE